jgi:multiple sugar transport system ATP-binding protein
LPDTLRERCGPWIGRCVDLGIRPEDVRLDPVPAAIEQRLPAVVELVQPMGSQAILNLDLEGIPFAVCSSIRDARPVGARVDVGLPPDRLHLFDPSSGHRI